MIAGRNHLQAGIDMSGIAHAGPVRYQQAMWFDGLNDNIFPTGSALVTAQLRIDATYYYGGSNGVGYQILINGPITAIWRVLIGYEFAAARWILHAYNGSTFRVLLIPQALTLYNKYVLQWDLNSATWATTWTVNGTPTAGTLSGGGGILTPGTAWQVGDRNVASSRPLKGIIHGITVTADGTPSIILPGDGVASSNWAGGTVNGSPVPAYIRGDGKVIVNNIIQNP